MAQVEHHQPPKLVIQPELNDILCGKDKQCVAHVGSVRFRSIIESYRGRYANSLTKFDKMQITKEIYETLSQNSRFLKFNTKDKMWEEISPMAARDKCGHALRFANRNKGKGKNAVGMRLAPETVSVVFPGRIISPSLSSSITSTAASPTVAAPVALPQLLEQAVAVNPGGAPQQKVWGELFKRYGTTWSTARIPASNGGTPSVPPAASVAGSPPAAPPTVVPAPNQHATAGSQIAGVVSDTNSVGASLAATVVASSLRDPGLNNLLLSRLGQQQQQQASWSSPPQQQRRKPTLEDLCSIITELGGK